MNIHTLIKIITELILPICGIIITKFIIPWLKAKYSAERIETLESWAWNAVQAAEKIFPAGLNADKYDYAVTYIKDQAARRGIDIDQDEIRTLIEAVVNLLPKTHEEA